jgi:hypothetical protein
MSRSPDRRAIAQEDHRKSMWHQFAVPLIVINWGFFYGLHCSRLPDNDRTSVRPDSSIFLDGRPTVHSIPEGI